MKRLLMILTLIGAAFATVPALAQNEPEMPDLEQLPSLTRKVWAGMYHFVEEETGDTLMMLVFNPIIIYPRERFRNKKEEEFYWKTVRDVKRTLPYAKVISATLLETYEYLETYKTKKEKYKAVVEAVKEAHEKGQPVLVGTITIQVSEDVSKMLRREGIQHNVLNAKFHEMEAEIVAQAGQHGAVTIATNMAGRGTDIKLDEEAKAAGGLKIIGTERHESRRIDNQLRGRSGRQGDPGESRFYISLEDDLMRLFGSDRMIAMFNALKIPEGEEISHKSLTKAVEGAQKKIEANNFGIRKNLLDYDQVMNEQREIMYKQRRQVLDGESMRDSILNMIAEVVERAVDISISEDQDSDEWNLTELNELLLPTIPFKVINRGRIKERTKNGLKQQLKEEALELYESKESEFPDEEAVRELERVVLLKVVDRKWMDHIDDMDQLRQSIGLQALGQHDPLVEYKIAGYDMFNEMNHNIMEETVRVLFHVKVEQKVEREEVAKVTGTNKDETTAKDPKRRVEKKIYPNDPCPCGSGKKYKNCCGRKQ